MEVILLTQNFKGTVLKNEIKGIEIVEETESYAVVKVGAKNMVSVCFMEH